MKKIHLLAAFLVLHLTIPAHPAAALSEHNARLIGEWNGLQIVQKGSQFFKLKNSEGDLEELRLPGVSQVLSLATGVSPMALVLKQGQLQILTKSTDKSWTAEPVPIKNKSKNIQLLSSGQKAVVIDSKRIFSRTQGRWKQIEPKASNNTEKAFEFDNYPTWALKDSFLYRGVNGGEWAGGLYALDLDKGNWTPVKGAESLRVTDLRIDPSGKILVTGKRRSRLQQQSLVLRVSRSGAQAMAEADKSGAQSSDGSPSPAFFYSVDFDSQGNPCYLTPDGVMKLKDGKWVVISKNWQKIGQMNPRQIMILKGLNKALLLTESSGVVVVDLSGL